MTIKIKKMEKVTITGESTDANRKRAWAYINRGDWRAIYSGPARRRPSSPEVSRFKIIAEREVKP